MWYPNRMLGDLGLISGQMQRRQDLDRFIELHTIIVVPAFNEHICNLL